MDNTLSSSMISGDRTSHPILNRAQFGNYGALKIYGDFLPLEIFFVSSAKKMSGDRR